MGNLRVLATCKGYHCLDSKAKKALRSLTAIAYFRGEVHQIGKIMAISFVDLLTDEEKGAIAAGCMANIYRFRRDEITSQELKRLLRLSSGPT